MSPADGRPRGFVIGHPRSGTQFVARLLSAGDSGAAEHERLWRLDRRCVSAPTAFYEGRLGADAIDRLLSAYDTRAGHAPIDCNWKLTWILPRVLHCYPQARILHLTRDPRDNVRSCHELDYYGALAARRELVRDPWRDFWLRWLPRVKAAGWSTMSPLERNCAFWCESHRLALEALEAHPARLRLRIEDLGDAAVVQALFGFFALPLPDPEALRRVAVDRCNAKLDEKHAVARLRDDPWRPEYDRLVARACGEMAARLGYGLEPRAA